MLTARDRRIVDKLRRCSDANFAGSQLFQKGFGVIFLGLASVGFLVTFLAEEPDQRQPMYMALFSFSMGVSFWRMARYNRIIRIMAQEPGESMVCEPARVSS